MLSRQFPFDFAIGHQIIHTTGIPVEQDVQSKLVGLVVFAGQEDAVEVARHRVHNPAADCAFHGQVVFAGRVRSREMADRSNLIGGDCTTGG